MKERGIFADARPMALERKQDAVHDSNGAEHTPSGQQPDLSRYEQLFLRIVGRIVEQNPAMDHVFIVAEPVKGGY
jgi:hypothetical protein